MTLCKLLKNILLEIFRFMNFEKRFVAVEKFTLSKIEAQNISTVRLHKDTEEI